MKKAILATKVGMTQIFNEDGQLIPVTVLQAGPCVVTQVKTEENDGYEAVQVGFGDIRESLVNKPEKGHFDKAGVAVKSVKGSYVLAVRPSCSHDKYVLVLQCFLNRQIIIYSYRHLYSFLSIYYLSKHPCSSTHQVIYRSYPTVQSILRNPPQI